MRCKCRVCYARRLSGERLRSCADYNPALSASGDGAGCSSVTVCSLPLTDLPDNQPRFIVTAWAPAWAWTGGRRRRTQPAKVARSEATSERDSSTRYSAKPPGRQSNAAASIARLIDLVTKFWVPSSFIGGFCLTSLFSPSGRLSRRSPLACALLIHGILIPLNIFCKRYSDTATKLYKHNRLAL